MKRNIFVSRKTQSAKICEGYSYVFQKSALAEKNRALTHRNNAGDFVDCGDSQLNMWNNESNDFKVIAARSSCFLRETNISFTRGDVKLFFTWRNERKRETARVSSLCEKQKIETEKKYYNLANATDGVRWTACKQSKKECVCISFTRGDVQNEKTFQVFKDERRKKKKNSRNSFTEVSYLFVREKKIISQELEMRTNREIKQIKKTQQGKWIGTHFILETNWYDTKTLRQQRNRQEYEHKSFVVQEKKMEEMRSFSLLFLQREKVSVNEESSGVASKAHFAKTEDSMRKKIVTTTNGRSLSWNTDASEMYAAIFFSPRQKTKKNHLWGDKEETKLQKKKRDEKKQLRGGMRLFAKKQEINQKQKRKQNGGVFWPKKKSP